MQNLKFKVILIIILLITTIQIITLNNSFQNSKENLNNTISLKIENIKILIKEKEKTIKNQYIKEISNIISDQNFQNNLENNNKEEYTKILKTKFDILKDIHPCLNSINLIDKNNILIFRSDMSDIWSDDLIDKRESRINVNKTKSIYTGYEKGIYNISFKIIIPIIYNGIHYGLLEAEIDLKNLAKKFNTLFHNDYIIILLKNKDAKLLKDKSNIIKINNSYSIYYQDSILKDFKFNLNDDIVTINNKKYKVTTNIIDNNHSFNFKIAYLQDITKYLENFQNTRNSFIFNTILLIIIISILIYFIFSSYEKKIKKLYGQNVEKQKLLTQSSKLAIMGEMLSLISHQWKQPLASQISILNTIKLKRRLNKLDTEYLTIKLEHIETLARHMNKTVTDFTNFFKPDKKMQSVLLEDSIKECYGLICEIFTQSEILVNIYAKDEISIKIYEGEFKQVILNILNNAKDALIENTIENKKIDIKIFKENNNAVITIEDNAKGIPKKIIKNIFEPYFSTKESNGTGLGLYMSKTIIEKHLKGEIFVQNSNIGAIFTIKIPL